MGNEKLSVELRRLGMPAYHVAKVEALELALAATLRRQRDGLKASLPKCDAALCSNVGMWMTYGNDGTYYECDKHSEGGGETAPWAWLVREIEAEEQIEGGIDDEKR